MKIKDIKCVEDAVLFLNSESFKGWKHDSTPTFREEFIWKKETVVAKIILIILEDGQPGWKFEVSAENLPKKRYWYNDEPEDRNLSFEYRENSEFYNFGFFRKWLKTALRWQAVDRERRENNDKEAEQEKSFADMVLSKYPGSVGPFFYDSGDYYGVQYFKHPEVGEFEVNKNGEIISIDARGGEARKAFRFLAYGEIDYFGNDVKDE